MPIDNNNDTRESLEVLEAHQQRSRQHMADQLSKFDQLVLICQGQQLCLCTFLHSDDSDGYISFKLKPVPMPGFTHPAQPWHIGSRWAYFKTSDTVWQSDDPLETLWRVDFDQERNQSLCQYAQALLENKPPLTPEERTARLLQCFKGLSYAND